MEKDYYLESLAGDYYFVPGEKEKARRYGEFAFDGEMALVREKGGRIATIFLVGGTRIERAGSTLVECTGTIDWVEVVMPAGKVKGKFTGKITVVRGR